MLNNKVIFLTWVSCVLSWYKEPSPGQLNIVHPLLSCCMSKYLYETRNLGRFFVLFGFRFLLLLLLFGFVFCLWFEAHFTMVGKSWLHGVMVADDIVFASLLN